MAAHFLNAINFGKTEIHLRNILINIYCIASSYLSANKCVLELVYEMQTSIFPPKNTGGKTMVFNSGKQEKRYHTKQEKDITR